MERKLNAIHKTKSRSQPDLYKDLIKNRTPDDDLYELCALSGVTMDKEVFKLVIDLLRLNVNPNTMIEVLRKISNQVGMKTSRSHDNINAKVGKSNSDRTANYSKMDLI